MKESLPMPAWRVSVARSRPVSIGSAALMGPPQTRSGRWPLPAQQRRTPPMLATIPPRGGCGSRGAPVVAHVGAALVEVDLLLADLLADLLLLGHGVLVQAHPLPWHRALLDHRLLLVQHHLLPPCSLPIPARRHAPPESRARHHTEADHRAIRPNRSSTAVAPPTAPAPWLRARGLLAGLVADLLGALLGPFGQVLPVLLAALLGGLGGVAGRLLGDLLAALQGLLPGLLDRVFDLVGHRTQPLVLDPGRRHGQAGQEADRGGPDGQPQRVLLGQP